MEFSFLDQIICYCEQHEALLKKAEAVMCSEGMTLRILEERIKNTPIDEQNDVAQFFNTFKFHPSPILEASFGKQSSAILKVWNNLCKNEVGFWGTETPKIFNCLDESAIRKICFKCNIKYEDYNNAIKVAYRDGVHINYNNESGDWMYSVENSESFWLESFETEKDAEEFIMLNRFREMG